jgi:hypothetical protein
LSPLDVAIENDSAECVEILRNFIKLIKNNKQQSTSSSTSKTLTINNESNSIKDNNPLKNDQPSLIDSRVNNNRIYDVYDISLLNTNNSIVSTSSLSNIKTSTFDESKFEVQLANDFNNLKLDTISKIGHQRSPLKTTQNNNLKNVTPPPPPPLPPPPPPPVPPRLHHSPLKSHRGCVFPSTKEELEEIISNIIDMKLENKSQNSSCSTLTPTNSRLRTLTSERLNQHHNSPKSSPVSSKSTQTRINSERILNLNNVPSSQPPPPAPPLPVSFSNFKSSPRITDSSTQTTGKLVKLNADKSNTPVPALPLNVIEELNLKLNRKNASKTAAPTPPPAPLSPNITERRNNIRLRTCSVNNSPTQSTNTNTPLINSKIDHQTSINSKIRHWLCKVSTSLSNLNESNQNQTENSSKLKSAMKKSEQENATASSSLSKNNSNISKLGLKTRLRSSSVGNLLKSIEQSTTNNLKKLTSPNHNSHKKSFKTRSSSLNRENNSNATPNAKTRPQTSKIPTPVQKSRTISMAQNKNLNLNGSPGARSILYSNAAVVNKVTHHKQQQAGIDQVIFDEIGGTFFKSVFGPKMTQSPRFTPKNYETPITTVTNRYSDESDEFNQYQVRCEPQLSSTLLTNDLGEQLSSDRTLYDGETFKTANESDDLVKRFQNQINLTNNYTQDEENKENSFSFSSECVRDFESRGYSAELIEELTHKLNLTTTSDIMVSNMFKCFMQQDVKWREGNVKSAFNYLLIDPRCTRDLPLRSKKMNEKDVFREFVSSIFYIGKGSRARPYAHLIDSLTHWKNLSKLNLDQKQVSDLPSKPTVSF